MIGQFSKEYKRLQFFDRSFKTKKGTKIKGQCQRLQFFPNNLMVSIERYENYQSKKVGLFSFARYHSFKK